MARPKSQIEYISRYKKQHIKKVSVEFNKENPEDMMIYEFLSTVKSKQGYIKNLLREAIKKHQ